MNYVSYTQSIAVGIIVVGTLVSGPGLGLVDLTRERTTGEKAELGTGNVSVEEVSFPATARLEEGRYSSGGGYYLRVPDGWMQLEERSGRPVLSYELNIEDLAFSRQSVYFLSEERGENVTLQIGRVIFPPDEIDQREYDAEFVLILRTNETEERVLATRNITLQVQE